MKDNPTPALPLSGEGVKGNTADVSTIAAKDNSADSSIKAGAKSDLINPQIKTSNKETPLAPPPDKGEAGRGVSNKTKLHNLKPQCNQRKQLRKNPTEPEKRFWSWVRGKQLGYKFRRQHGIGAYIVDFYCAEPALIIELDGDSHYTPESIAYDNTRTHFLTSNGFKVIRFTNLDIIHNKEGVLITLLSSLKKGNQNAG